jgi:hypothetical protein
MKTTFAIRIAIVGIAVSGLIFACNKNNSNSGNQQTASNLGTQADDQTMISNENENVSNDINTVLVSQVSTNGDSKSPSIISGTTEVNGTAQVNGASTVSGDLICDATVAFDTASNPRTITITYNGTNCWGNRSRNGTVVISMAAGIHWRDAGAVVSVSIQNLNITRLSDGKSIILNGLKTITNTSGGDLKNLASIGTITHTISDSLSITFADSATRTWYASRTRVFSYNNGIVLTTTGNHSDGTHQGIAEWGTNRFGVSFIAMILQPMIIRQDCDFRITGGEYQIIRSDNISSTITFGLDANGNESACPGSGHYYLEVIWTDPNGRSYPIILPY